MKLNLTSLAATLLLCTKAARSSRELEQNGYYNNYNGNNANGNNGYYQNFDEYVKSKMASRSFSFTGCSSPPTEDGQYKPTFSYVTFRLCDSCSSSGSCSSTNGDYSASMRTFSESFGEYVKEIYGMEYSPFDCVR